MEENDFERNVWSDDRVFSGRISSSRSGESSTMVTYIHANNYFVLIY